MHPKQLLCRNPAGKIPMSINDDNTGDSTPDLLARLRAQADDLRREAHARLQAQPRRAAQLHEQTVMLELLRLCPMHAGNLVTINYHEDFVRNDAGHITGFLIPKERTKYGCEIKFVIPADLADRIHTHVAEFRPHLPGAESPQLFPSPQRGLAALKAIAGNLHVIRAVLHNRPDAPAATPSEDLGKEVLP
jgi:hypothetical protein